MNLLLQLSEASEEQISSVKATKDWTYYLDKSIEYVIEYTPKVLLAIAIWFIGNWIVTKLTTKLGSVLKKNKYDDTLQFFVVSMVRWVLKLTLIFMVLGSLGIDTSKVFVIIGAAGLAIGLALQGSLANFAGGVLIIALKPFKMGDLIEVEGEIGTVLEINIFNTHIASPDNKKVIIPNGSIIAGNIKNYTALGKLRIDHVIGVHYDTDLKQAKEVLLKAIADYPNTLKHPAPSINLTELADSSVNFAVRPWTTPENYWDVYFGTLEACKIALDQAGIEIPYPHSVELTKEL